MSVEGMDVDAVAGLARRVDAHTRTLESIAAQLDGLATELGRLWRGPAAATFQHECQTRHRPAIIAAARATSDMHQHLTANLAEQHQASAADAAGSGSLAADGPGMGSGVGQGGGAGPGGDAGPGGGGGGGWTPARAWNDLANATKIYGTLTLPFGVMELLGKSGPLFDVIDNVGYLGTAVGVGKTIDDVSKTADAMDEGRYLDAANDFADGVTDGLKAIPDPVTYGVGVDLTLLHEVAQLDWQDTPNPFSGGNFRQYYQAEFKDMKTAKFWGDYASTLWNAM